MNDLKALAQQTLHISQTGKLPTKNGVVDFLSEQTFAQDNSVLFTPDTLQNLLDECLANPKQGVPCQIDVWACSTQEAAFKMSKQGDVVLLNFASAKNIGGGFLGGAKAQEEDLCRASGLYLCQSTCPDYYQQNKAEKSAIYTDYMIYSPRVPFFRVDNQSLLDEVFLSSVITAPAPNMGAYLAKHPDGKELVERAFVRRVGLLLALIKHLGYKRLILGAWGCGVFKNDPTFVAHTFYQWLTHPAFVASFEQVVFAIYDNSKDKRTLQSFRQQFVGA